MIETSYKEQRDSYNSRHNLTEPVRKDSRRPSNKPPKRGKKKKGSSTGKKVGIVILIIIICLILALAGTVAHYLGLFGKLGDAEVGQKVTISSEERMTTESELNDDIYNFMLVGVDSRNMYSYEGRSDSMIVISINKQSKKMVMTSVLRDSYVSIPGHGNNKLNAAYALGGTSLLCDTIEANYGIKVDNVAVVNFKTVADFVDAVGGVDLYISAEERAQINKNLGEQNRLFGYSTYKDTLGGSTVGDVHLNGNQALAYARIRYIDTDFGRTKRQRTVLSACMEKVQNLSVSELNDLITQFLPKVHTDLSAGQILSMAPVFIQSKSYTIESISIPENGTWSDYWTPSGQEALAVDFEANKQYWESMVR